MPSRPAPAAAGRPHAAHYIASGVAAVCCVVLLGLAAREARGVLARRTEGVALIGTVTQRRVPSAAGKRSAKAGPSSIEYTVAASYQGRAVQVVNRFRHSSAAYRVGENVPIIYVPNQPEHSRLATTTEQYGQLLQLTGFGLLSGFAAGLLWLRKRTAEALFRGRPQLPPDATP
ncbi:DUF3592 domain-containing protein [Hymenobacter sp. 15J16-1T3B]|uniref:DUF3592 domain-containing protein n=1 Tax=Hymenobacter sp. 15J16-1T3B TaxID=2886941 RepID=UPI001D110D02|nr:DUF3592 domain-containing protein [Hymenobacter sp. 15J16-1T3B]MCC3155918.1 DUF3592 domain-containing protein [Hymenobacter sp. 15J16-1T3B]